MLTLTKLFSRSCLVEPCRFRWPFNTQMTNIGKQPVLYAKCTSEHFIGNTMSSRLIGTASDLFSIPYYIQSVSRSLLSKSLTLLRVQNTWSLQTVSFLLRF